MSNFSPNLKVSLKQLNNVYCELGMEYALLSVGLYTCRCRICPSNKLALTLYYLRVPPLIVV